MECPRCQSSRIQRGYNDARIPLRFVGLRELLCNNCGLEFKGLDPLGRLKRIARRGRDTSQNRRRVPRYRTHLPATVHLAKKNLDSGKVSYSEPSRGHCESISKYGFTLSFVGTRFTEEQLSLAGQLLFVTIDLPDGQIDAVVSIVAHERSGGEHGKRVVGVSVLNMNDSDTARLAAYLDKCAERERVLALD
jgi:PilZ domain-containing protein